MSQAARTPASRAVRGDRSAVVPAAEVRTYYDRPVIKPPVWKPEVPWYFFFGGMSGAASLLATAAEAGGQEALATSARRVSAASAVASPVLLVADLGVPSRFLNMLRVFRPTSALNMGSWLLTAYVPATVGAAVLRELGWFPRLCRLASGVSGVGALGMSTYTAVLVSDTAVPVWHEARRELPFAFAATAGATAGASTLLLTREPDAGPARKLTVACAALERAAVKVMERRLGPLAQPYEEAEAGRYARAAKWSTAAGAVLTAFGRRRRAVSVAGASLVLAGGVLERWAVFKAGFQSARRPGDTVAPQRARADERQAGSAG